MIGFRVDANEKIATGHLMRCIAIATECQRRGLECLFILAEDKETERLRERGFAYHILNTRWDDMESEKEKMKQLLQEKQLDWLVVDSYQATASYLAFLNQLVSVVYIPDLVEQGKNPLSIDSPAPTESYRDFIMGEVRYDSLTLKFPERAEALFAEAEKIATERYEALVKQQKSLEPGKEGEN